MKMYEGVLKRVRQIEEKRGITYANVDGTLYKTLKVLFIIALVWTVLINSILIMSGSLSMYSIHHGTTSNIDGKEYTLYENWEMAGSDADAIANNIIKNNRGLVINASVCTVLLIIGAILNKFRLYIPAAVTNVSTAVYGILYFKQRLTDSNGEIGVNAKFYWCHLIPLLMIIICMVWLTVIAVRANYKVKKLYRRVTENLFNTYNVSLAEGGTLTDEQWDEFLEKYDPTVDYSRQSALAEENEG